MLILKPTVVVMLVVLPVGLVAVTARAETAIQGELSLGGGSVSGLVDPEGHPASLGGLLAGVSLGLRLGHLILGGSAESVSEVLGHHDSFLAAHAGGSVGDASARFTATGEYGRHSYSDLGSGLLTGNHATSASLPFVGARIGVDVGSPGLALWLAVRRDFRTASAGDAGPIWGSAGTWQVGGTAICMGAGFGFDAILDRTHSPSLKSGPPSESAPW